MAQKKHFKDLNLNNAFMFAAALENSEICKQVLEIILEESVGTVSVKTERSVLVSSDFRSIRLDVFANNECNTGYNLEMQNRDEKNLPKRSRFHQAEMDLVSLKPGQDFNDLTPSLILFICTFDPFHKGKYRYTFEQRCLEENFALGDETKRIFLSTKGKNDDEVPETLIHFLNYIEDSTDTYVNKIHDSKISRLHEMIQEFKKSRGLEEHYMMFEELLQSESREGFERGRLEGLEQGLHQGTQRILILISRMNDNGEADKVARLSRDEEFCREMLKKYNL